MKITKIGISNWIGIDEFEYCPSELSILVGPKGSGKSSVIEAIETAFTNNKRRKEVVRHNESEATLLIETDSGLQVSRKIRTDGARDYLKLRSSEGGITSSEKELRKIFNGDVFRPLDFIGWKPEAQTDAILSMIVMEYTDEEICEWFNDKTILNEINTLKHILQILKDIETTQYERRTELNRQIASYEHQIEGIKKALPPDYVAEEWRDKKLQEYYQKVSEAKDLNARIEKNEMLRAGFETRVAAIESERESKHSKLDLAYNVKESDINDMITMHEQKIASLKQERGTLVEKKAMEAALINQESDSLSVAQNLAYNEAGEYLEGVERVDVGPLEREAEDIEFMRSFLNEYDRMVSIENKDLLPKREKEKTLTVQINTARSKPTELLMRHKLPLEGISIDENGMIRINGTLLDGLSDGEKLETAFLIAIQRMGELKIVCLDGIHDLNESEQVKILQLCEDNDIQAFVTKTADTATGEMVIKEEF